jgi:hypothetical protein
MLVAKWLVELLGWGAGSCRMFSEQVEQAAFINFLQMIFLKAFCSLSGSAQLNNSF